LWVAKGRGASTTRKKNEIEGETDARYISERRPGRVCGAEDSTNSAGKTPLEKIPTALRGRVISTEGDY